MRVLHPSADACFVAHRGRLALFHRAQDPQVYWRQYWRAFESSGGFAKAASEALGYFERFLHFVPKDLPVLDAGCGPGDKMIALQERGYRCVGVDYEARVVERVHELRPELDVRVQDVEALDLPEASFGCYLSGGVIEHFEDGPGKCLSEAARILAPGGVALISVPYLNPARASLHTALAQQGEGPPEGYSFHQYYFDEASLASALAEHGLELMASSGEDGIAHLTREHPIFARFWRSSLARTRVKRVLRPMARRLADARRQSYGHMLQVVARRAVQ